MEKNNKISASHILIMHSESQGSRSKISKNNAKKKIDDIHKDIVSKKIRFNDAAVTHSDCPSGKDGGNLGEFGKGVMVKAFEDIAFSLKKEQISDPFESDFGFHIVRRDK
tara:strand:- start:294 stop:623 length:330 start_codon:yes stop_codon:yes gene_type:complete